MGKWIARLKAKAAYPLSGVTDETDETPQDEVLSVLSVGAERGAVNSSPMHPALHEFSVTRTDEESTRFRERRARLIRWGWPEAEAQSLAEYLARRDRTADNRVSCTDCQHYRPGRCGNHRRANLHGSEVGRDLASLLQRCPGFCGREELSSSEAQCSE